MARTLGKFAPDGYHRCADRLDQLARVAVEVLPVLECSFEHVAVDPTEQVTRDVGDELSALGVVPHVADRVPP